MEKKNVSSCQITSVSWRKSGITWFYIRDLEIRFGSVASSAMKKHRWAINFIKVLFIWCTRPLYGGDSFDLYKLCEWSLSGFLCSDDPLKTRMSRFLRIFGFIFLLIWFSSRTDAEFDSESLREWMNNCKSKIVKQYECQTSFNQNFVII